MKTCSSIEQNLLLVRHGPGRGPKIRLSALRRAYFQPFLDDLTARYPLVRQRIHIWETGSGRWPELSRFRAVVFLLMDPLRERYPACYEECASLAAEAQSRGLHLVNPPDALSNSIKSRQSHIWRAAGIPTPPHFRYEDRDELNALLGAVAFPAIVRSDLDHSQAGLRFCQSPDDVFRIKEAELPRPGTITPFIDTRGGFRVTAPDSTWAKYYHKKRAHVFGNVVRYSHVFFSCNPVVSVRTSTFGHYRSLNPIRRSLGAQRCREHVSLDREFFAHGDPLDDLMRRAACALGLELVAIDYSTTADGNAVLWEANPHFALHAWPFQILARTRHVNERIRKVHDDLQAFFAELIADDNPLGGYSGIQPSS